MGERERRSPGIVTDVRSSKSRLSVPDEVDPADTELMGWPPLGDPNRAAKAGKNGGGRGFCRYLQHIQQQKGRQHVAVCIRVYLYPQVGEK